MTSVAEEHICYKKKSHNAVMIMIMIYVSHGNMPGAECHG